MTDLEFQILLSCRRTPQRESHFQKLGEAHVAALRGLLEREFVERIPEGEGKIRVIKLTHKGRQQAQTEWIHRGRPTLEQLLAKIARETEGQSNG